MAVGSEAVFFEIGSGIRVVDVPFLRERATVGRFDSERGPAVASDSWKLMRNVSAVKLAGQKTGRREECLWARMDLRRLLCAHLAPPSTRVTRRFTKSGVSWSCW